VLTGPGAAEDPLAAVERRELLSLGALTLLERLSPAERAVLVLREAMELTHAEIGRAVGVSEAASRQLLTRARRRVAGAPARARPAPADHRRLVEALRAAFDTGDAGRLAALLREDMVLVSDGGGEVLAARRPMLGRDRALRFWIGISGKLPPGLTTVTGEVNGEACLLVHVDGELAYVLALVGDGQDRIAQTLVVAAPSKLACARRQETLSRSAGLPRR
jgi:RNA polymerase sigma-70 factor (ECF subfamily)